MSEKRRAQRCPLLYYLEVLDQRSQSLMGRLVNISTTGLMVFSAQHLVTGVEYALRLVLPAEIYGRHHLDFSAKCVWARVDVNPAYHIYGLQFNATHDQQTDAIINLIIDFGFPD